MTRRTLSVKSIPPQGTPVETVVPRECMNCRFFDFPDEGATTCRRRSPYIEHATGAGVWPMVDPDQWCAEFKRLPLAE